MNNLIIKFIVTIFMVNALILAQQKRIMYDKLVEKKGVVFIAGDKKPYTGRVFDNYRNNSDD